MRRTLKRLSNDIAPQLDRAGVVKVDMAGVRELDTLGAWLLEKMSRRTTSAGHRADMTGVSDNYAGLIDEVRQVNRRTPAPVPAHNPVATKLGDIGRATIDAREDVTAFLQMLGALCIAILGVLRRPRSLRLTSLTYQLYRVVWQAIPIVVLITFLIGAIIAQQGIFHFRKFGADSYVVDMVGICAARTRCADRRHHGRRTLRVCHGLRFWQTGEARAKHTRSTRESIDRARGEPLQSTGRLHPRPRRRPVRHRAPAGRRDGCGPLYSERRPPGGKAGRRRRQRRGGTFVGGEFPGPEVPKPSWA